MFTFLSAIKFTPMIITAIIGILIFLVSLIFNIKNKSFNPLKFISGFNIFNGQVQGKLIYFFIIFSFVAAMALGVYNKIVQPTTNYDNNYRNEIKQNEEVVIDQRQIIIPAPETKRFGLELFGLHFGFSFNGKSKNIEKVENNTIKTK